MSDRGTRMVVAILVIPVAGIAAFYGVGTLAGLRLAGPATGMADAATVALLAVAAFAVAGLAAGILTWKSPARLLVPVATVVLLLSAVAVWWTVGARTRLPHAAAVDSTPIARPIAVGGGDSLLAMMNFDTPPDGTGLLPEPLDLRGGPSAASPVLVTVTRWSDLEAAETGYEEPSISIYRIADPWYLVSTRDSIMGWVHRPDGATVVPLADLLTDRLTYLTAAWDGMLHDTPGAAGHPVEGLVLDHGEASVAVLGTRTVHGAEWVHVAVHQHSPCESATDPTVLATGWVPMWTGARPTVWYYSRGC